MPKDAPVKILMMINQGTQDTLRGPIFGVWGTEGEPKCLAKKSEEVYRKEPGAFPPCRVASARMRDDGRVKGRASGHT